MKWPGRCMRCASTAASTPVPVPLSGDRVPPLATLTLPVMLPLPPSVHERLRQHPVTGLVDSLDARWDGPLEAPVDWRVRGRLSGLAVAALPASRVRLCITAPG